MGVEDRDGLERVTGGSEMIDGEVVVTGESVVSEEVDRLEVVTGGSETVVGESVVTVDDTEDDETDVLLTGVVWSVFVVDWSVVVDADTEVVVLDIIVVRSERQAHPELIAAFTPSQLSKKDGMTTGKPRPCSVLKRAQNSKPRSGNLMKARKQLFSLQTRGPVVIGAIEDVTVDPITVDEEMLLVAWQEDDASGALSSSRVISSNRIIAEASPIIPRSVRAQITLSLSSAEAVVAM